MTDVFMRIRPAPGKAFYCNNDIGMLATLATTGVPDHQSQTNVRSILILHAGGLIDGMHEGKIEVTLKGLALLDRIRNMPLE